MSYCNMQNDFNLTTLLYLFIYYLLIIAMQEFVWLSFNMTYGKSLILVLTGISHILL